MGCIETLREQKGKLSEQMFNLNMGCIETKWFGEIPSNVEYV